MTTSDHRETIEKALINGVSVTRVLSVNLGRAADGHLLVCARIDLAGDLTMREVSVVLHQAKRRVESALAGEQVIVTIEPDVYLDPNAAVPPTSSIVMLSSD